MRKVIVTETDINNQVISRVVTESTEGGSSVELTPDAKGNIKATVKVYNDDIFVAKDEAVKCWNSLKDIFGDSMLGDKKE